MSKRRLLTALVLLGFVVTLATEACTGVVAANAMVIGADEGEPIVDTPIFETETPAPVARPVAFEIESIAAPRVAAQARLPVFLRTRSLLL